MVNIYSRCFFKHLHAQYLQLHARGTHFKRRKGDVFIIKCENGMCTKNVKSAVRQSLPKKH